MDIIKIDISTQASHFWNALKIYHQHPNSINKQVLFSKDIFIAELLSNVTLNECQQFFDNFCDKLLKKCSMQDILCTEELAQYNIVQLNNVEVVFSLSNKMFLIIRKLFPKLNMSDSFEFFEFIFLDKSAVKVYIFTKSVSISPDEMLTNEVRLLDSSIKSKTLDPYVILKFNFIELSLCDNSLELVYQKNFSEKGTTWLHATFSPKFKKLILNECETKNSNLKKIQVDNNVNIVEYYKLYEEMKYKYAKYFIENWTENTDPKKFVYEDIGIATYLMMLWNGGNIPEKNSKKEKFIDLGCGNGLLVHILNSEGHSGIGIDIRKRKLWNIYPSSTILLEKAIIPSVQADCIYPEADWLIGNHSDELTAWIPIMARLSNNHCQYFVLPCCPYQLNGMKFQRKNSGCSSYQDFLNYMKKISQICNFETYIDKLRIPSTKKLCLVGLRKSEISKENYVLVNETVLEFVNKECQTLSKNNSKIQETEENKISLNFKIRKSVEPVRNCTKLPKAFTDEVLKMVRNELLKEHVTYQIIRNGKTFAWNRGKKLLIQELASCLNADVLKQLKNECKGLQTLLKNHHFIFEISHGCVQFRSPENLLQLCRKYLETHNEKWKFRKCWFFNNHPDQCPLSDDDCSYSHCK